MHRLLEQQTKRFLRKNAPLPPGGDMFLAAVDDACSSADADRQRLECSLELMSKELAGLRADLAERQLAEAQLEHLLSLLGAILESTTDGMLALNRDGKIVRFNQRLVEMWNIPDEIMAFWKHQKVMMFWNAWTAGSSSVIRFRSHSAWTVWEGYRCRFPGRRGSHVNQRPILSTNQSPIVSTFPVY